MSVNSNFLIKTRRVLIGHMDLRVCEGLVNDINFYFFFFLAILNPVTGCKNGHSCPLPCTCALLQCDFTVLPVCEWRLSPHSLTVSWPRDFLWQIELIRSDVIPMLQEAFNTLLVSLTPCWATSGTSPSHFSWKMQFHVEEGQPVPEKPL